MRILFDQGTPAPLRAHLAGHDVTLAYERGWSTLKNGDLLKAAETEGFDCLLTTDQNLSYQQNLSSRTIAILVLRTTSWPRIRPQVGLVLTALSGLAPGGYVEVAIP